MASGKRNWDFVAWIESSPPDWADRLNDLHVPLCYIVHDKDKEKDGTPKKEHVHGCIFYDGPIPYDQALNDLKSVFMDGINTVERQKSKYGSLLYLIHAKDHDKWQYSANDVVSCSGADYFRDVVSAQDPHEYYGDIKSFIDLNNITEYYDLSRIAQYFYPEWQRSIDYNSMFWVKYLISKVHKAENNGYTSFDLLIDEVTKKNGN